METATGSEFRIYDIGIPNIKVQVESGSIFSLHKEHLLQCLHWLTEGNTIAGVGGQGNSVRGLVGADGTLIQCGLCDRTPAYIWGILYSMPNIKRQNNQLNNA